MPIFYKCKICGANHPSPIELDKKSFESADLRNNTFECPIKRKSANYDKEDMFWAEDIELKKKKEGIPLNGSVSFKDEPRFDGTTKKDELDD